MIKMDHSFDLFKFCYTCNSLLFVHNACSLAVEGGSSGGDGDTPAMRLTLSPVGTLSWMQPALLHCLQADMSSRPPEELGRRFW